MAISFVCSILFAIGAGDPVIDGALRYGPWKHYTFKPTAKLEVKTATVSVRLYLPMLRATSQQNLLRMQLVPDDLTAYEIFDKGKLNGLMRYNLEVLPGRASSAGFDAVVATRSVMLDLKKANEDTTSRRLTSDERRRLSRFLKLTASTGRDRAELREAAVAAASDETDPLALAQRMYERTIRRLRYVRKNDFKGAAKAWDDGVGECGDYAAVFVGLCRAVKVPARAVAGYTFREQGWDRHVWAEFYVRPIGWIPCDPSYDGTEMPNAAPKRLRHFGRMDDQRIAVTRDFDLEFGAKDNLKTPILQEYLFEYQGPERPTITWSIKGEYLGADPPK